MFATNGKHLFNPSNAEATLLQSTGIQRLFLLSGLVHITPNAHALSSAQGLAIKYGLRSAQSSEFN